MLEALRNGEVIISLLDFGDTGITAFRSDQLFHGLFLQMFEIHSYLGRSAFFGLRGAEVCARLRSWSLGGTSNTLSFHEVPEYVE